jgi:hypothetical protein
MIKIKKFGLKSKKVCQMSKTSKRMKTFMKNLNSKKKRKKITMKYRNQMMNIIKSTSKINRIISMALVDLVKMEK